MIMNQKIILYNWNLAFNYFSLSLTENSMGVEWQLLSNFDLPTIRNNIAVANLFYQNDSSFRNFIWSYLLAGKFC